MCQETEFQIAIAELRDLEKMRRAIEATIKMNRKSCEFDADFERACKDVLRRTYRRINANWHRVLYPPDQTG